MIATRPRRSARALTACLRAALAEGSPEGGSLSRSFLRDLARLDPELECHWHHRSRRWVLYRLARRGVIPSEDYMVKEIEVLGPRGEFRQPGQWLIDRLRKIDKTRGGAVCPGYANRRWLGELDLEPKRQEEAFEARSGEMAMNLYRDLESHAFNRKRTQVLGQAKRSKQ